MMELNAKSPLFWDWENLVMLNQKTEVGATKKQPTMADNELEAMQEGFEVESLYSWEGRSDGGGSGVSPSELGRNGSSPKSSKSASVDSATNTEMNESRFLSVTSNSTHHELNFERGSTSAWSGKICSLSATYEAPGESMIGLKLGKRTYFEDVSAAGSAKMNAVAPVSPAAAAATRRSKSSPLNVASPRCQVEGCNLDLSSAKDYHRKHKVCENHSKSPRVIVAGIERRFCQQCSRFHSLSEFDQKKRSCRKRLSDHNARRRKPKPNILHFGTMRPSSSLYGTCNLQTEGRQQMGVSANQVPFVHTRLDSDTAKFAQAKFSLFTSTTDGLLDSGVKLSHDSHQLLPLKGLQGHVPSPSNVDAPATQDTRALSLLSSGPWCHSDSQPAVLDSLNLLHQSSVAASSSYWNGGQSSTPPSYIKGPGNHHQDFQLFRDPQEASFYMY